MSKNNSRYNLQKLVDKLKEYEYVVRFEKGNFKSGYCILADKKVVIINKFHDIDSRVETLRLILSEIRSEVLIDA